jgi:hypothetical protein
MNDKVGIEMSVKQMEVYITLHSIIHPHGVCLGSIAKLTVMTELLVPDIKVRLAFGYSHHLTPLAYS